jgi:hypothetical protein
MRKYVIEFVYQSTTLSVLTVDARKPAWNAHLMFRRCDCKSLIQQWSNPH